MGIIRPEFMTDAQRHHELAYGKQFARQHVGALPHDDFWEYLRDRREINEPRFDHYHPVVGRLLRREEMMPHPPLPVIPPACMPLPPVGVACVPIPEPTGHVVETPEPSSLLIALAMIFGAIIARRVA